MMFANVNFNAYLLDPRQLLLVLKKFETSECISSM